MLVLWSSRNTNNRLTTLTNQMVIRTTLFKPIGGKVSFGHQFKLYVQSKQRTERDLGTDRRAIDFIHQVGVDFSVQLQVCLKQL